MFVVVQLYRGLLRYLPDSSIVPDLAESWTESDAHTRFVFKLRDATFSDGSPITAEQVVWTFARMFRIRAAMAGDLGYIEGVLRFEKTGDVKDLGIRALSDNRIEFRLSHRSALFFKHLATADCGILKVSAEDRTFRASAPVSGPYKVENSSASEIVLAKWRPDPMDSPKPPERIRFFPTPKSPAETALMGLTDSLANDLVTEKERAALEAKGWKKVVGGLARERFVVMHPQFVSIETRRWLYHQIRSEELTATLKLNVEPAFGFIPFTLPGHLGQGDVAAIRSENAGVPKKVKLQLDYLEGDPTDALIAEYLRQRWNHMGVRVTPKAYPVNEYLDRLFKTKSALILGKKSMDYPDGYSVLGYFQNNYDGSYFHIADSQIDLRLRAAVRELDDVKRAILYRDIQGQVLRNYTLIPIAFGSTESGLWSPRLVRVPPHPMGFHTLPLETLELAR